MSLVTQRTDDRITSITLSAPPVNALGEALLDDLQLRLDRVAPTRARAVVISSDVAGIFVAGADLKLLAATDVRGFERYLLKLRGVLERITTLPQTTVAAVDGAALGGGLELAMACSLRVVSPVARLGVPEIRLGLLPGAQGTQRLTHLIGPSRASDLLLTGRSVGGEVAMAWGLADRLAHNPLAAAHELAGDIAHHPRPAAMAARRCVEAARGGDLGVGSAVELAEILALFDSADAREGISAFAEKRPPKFA